MKRIDRHDCLRVFAESCSCKIRAEVDAYIARFVINKHYGDVASIPGRATSRVDDTIPLRDILNRLRHEIRDEEEPPSRNFLISYL